MFESISPSHPGSFYWIFQLVISYYMRKLLLANKLAKSLDLLGFKA